MAVPPRGLLRLVLAAEDGTLVAQPVCQPANLSAPCGPALVRTPARFGAAGAWRVVAVPGALTHRPLSRGDVLVAHADDAGRLALTVARTEGEPIALARGVAIPHQATDLDVVRRGAVVLHLRDAERRRQLVELQRDGSLEPFVEPSPRE